MTPLDGGYTEIAIGTATLAWAQTAAAYKIRWAAMGSATDTGPHVSVRVLLYKYRVLLSSSDFFVPCPSLHVVRSSSLCCAWRRARAEAEQPHDETAPVVGRPSEHEHGQKRAPGKHRC